MKNYHFILLVAGIFATSALFGWSSSRIASLDIKRPSALAGSGDAMTRGFKNASVQNLDIDGYRMVSPVTEISVLEMSHLNKKNTRSSSVYTEARITKPLPNPAKGDDHDKMSATAVVDIL
jgi:hypothetical protein